MKKAIIVVIVIVLILIGVAAYLILTKKPAGPGPAAGPITTTTSPAAKEPVVCSDPPCLSSQFLNCNSSELRMPFIEKSTYVITVLGLEGGKCHYKSKVVGEDGTTLLNGETDCKVPAELVTADTLGHFFGQDKTPGQEAVKAQQDKIESDYCTKTNP